MFFSRFHYCYQKKLYYHIYWAQLAILQEFRLILCHHAPDWETNFFPEYLLPLYEYFKVSNYFFLFLILF